MNQNLYKNRFWLPLLAMFAMLLASCSNSWLPTEFKLKRVLYQTSDGHIVGPGGFNHSFTVYELPQDVAATISAKGLSYLNSLSTNAKTVPEYEGAPWWGPFSDWRATPVPSEKAWLRYGRALEKDWTPSIKNFYVSRMQVLLTPFIESLLQIVGYPEPLNLTIRSFSICEFTH